LLGQARLSEPVGDAKTLIPELGKLDAEPFNDPDGVRIIRLSPYVESAAIQGSGGSPSVGDSIATVAALQFGSSPLPIGPQHRTPRA